MGPKLSIAGAGGKTGAGAKKVPSLLYPHLAKEEQYALPPSGRIRAFADGEVPASADEVVARTERFRAEYPRMLEEHEDIGSAVGDLPADARGERRNHVADFATSLLHDAQSEGEVLYPTTFLTGGHAKLTKDPPRPRADRDVAAPDRRAAGGVR